MEKQISKAEGWFGLGEGLGIKWILESDNLLLQRQEKQFDKWITTEEIHLPKSTLKELYWRITRFLEILEDDLGELERERELE